MIRKSDLVDAINGLSHDLVNLSIKVNNLQRKVDSIKTDESNICTIPVKRISKCPRKCTQPRDKSGKFTKKK